MDMFDVMNPFAYLSWSDSMNAQGAIDIINQYPRSNSVPEKQMDYLLDKYKVDFCSLPNELQQRIADIVID